MSHYVYQGLYSPHSLQESPFKVHNPKRRPQRGILGGEKTGVGKRAVSLDIFFAGQEGRTRWRHMQFFEYTLKRLGFC